MKINNERALTSAFSYYLRKTKDLPDFLKQSCCIEFKLLKGNRLNFKSDLRPVQIPSLHQANTGLLYWKIPDFGYDKPFDSFILYHTPAWLAIAFHDDTALYFLTVDTVMEAMKTHKSLDRFMIMKISSEVINLNV
jgi:hypothetical protein